MMDLERETKHKSKGSMITAVLFVVFVTFIGFTLLTHTIIQNRIIKHRIKKITETEKIQQELIHYLHHFREKIFNENLRNVQSPETDYFSCEFFPEKVSNQVIIKNNFRNRIEEKSFYRKIRIINNIDARSLKSNHVLNADAIIDLLSGNIPLSLISLFINTKINIPPEIYLEENNIEIKNPANFIIDDIPVDFDISSFLIDALKIKGDLLNWAEIRKKFGFEISDDPINNGIYFIIENNSLESIFIQGDLQKLIFAVYNELQVIQFHFEGKSYEIRYQPGEEYFRSWNDQIQDTTLFNEKIIVNGNLWCLEQQGKSAFNKNSNIKLLVSGQTIIRTSLETENLELEKLKLTNLTLIASYHNLYNLENKQPEILVETKDKTKIQATIIANGAFGNNCSELELSGSLFAKTMQNDGKLTINFIRSGFDSGQYFHTGNITTVFNFFIDFIEEVYNV